MIKGSTKGSIINLNVYASINRFKIHKVKIDRTSEKQANSQL